MSSGSLQRLEARAKKLEASAAIFKSVRSACMRIWADSYKFPRAIRIRRPFVLVRRKPLGLILEAIELPERYAPSWGRSPLTSLISSRGIALQLYLICLFEAQCRCRPGVEPMNNRPLQPQHGSVSWLDLLATTAVAKAPATPRDNRLRQMKKALLHLERELLIEIPGGRHVNGRFQGFRLLNESGLPTETRSLVRYTVPTEEEDTIELPVDFFLNGWVHVLSPAEIATYLMLLDLRKQHREVHDSHGIFSPTHIREGIYGLSRDSYESHRSLVKFGLIEKMPNMYRRDDGKVTTFKVRFESHHFKVNPYAHMNDPLEVIPNAIR